MITHTAVLRTKTLRVSQRKGDIMNIKHFIILSLLMIILAFSVNASNKVMDFPVVRAVLIGQTPDPAEPGDIIELRFNAWNNGSGILEDVTFELVPQWPLSLAPGQSAKIIVGDLKTKNRFSSNAEDTVVLLYYRLKVDPKAPSGTYQVTLNYDSTNKYTGLQKLPLYNIRVESSRAQLYVDSFETVPEKVKAGETSKLTVKVSNNGGVSLKDIKLNLYLTGTDFSPIGSTNEKQVGLLPIGQSAVVEYNLIATGDMKAKEYQIPLKIEYKDESNTKYEKNNTITMLVDSSPDYVLGLEQTDVSTENTKGKIVISLSNTGQSDLKYLTMELMPTDNYEVLGKKSEYLGNLESDDYETADFILFVKDITFPNGKERRDMPLKVKIDYKDSYNKEYNEEKEVILPIYKAGAAKKYGLTSSSSLGTIVFIIVIIGAIAGYVMYKRRKNKK